MKDCGRGTVQRSRNRGGTFVCSLPTFRIVSFRGSILLGGSRPHCVGRERKKEARATWRSLRVRRLGNWWMCWPRAGHRLTFDETWISFDSFNRSSVPHSARTLSHMLEALESGVTQSSSARTSAGRAVAPAPGGSSSSGVRESSAQKGENACASIQRRRQLDG